MRTVYIVSLGCDKNRVDTENMLYLLHNGGYGVASGAEASDVIIVNTCAFIESARVEAIETILELARDKRKAQKLVVTGCLSQKYRDELKKELPEVDAFLGVREYEGICGILDGLLECKIQNAECKINSKDKFGRIRTTPNHYAYLRIADGCNNKCAFCTVPSIRGPYLSRTQDSLIDEASKLAAQGVRELIIIAQDVTRYGSDFAAAGGGTRELCRLLEKLSLISGIDYLRLMYCYPDMVDAPLIEAVRDNPKIVKYMDIPMQHAADKVLRAMGRKGNNAELKRLVDALYTAIPGFAVRTTFMVGFPGEGEAEFAQLKEFITWAKFRHAGFFAYSREEDTPSSLLPNHISEELKAARLNEVAALQAGIAEAQNRRLIGKTVRAVYEDIDYGRNMFIARPLFSAPEVDSLIYFTAPFADIGRDVDIKVTGAEGYDLIGLTTDD